MIKLFSGLGISVGAVVDQVLILQGSAMVAWFENKEISMCYNGFQNKTFVDRVLISHRLDKGAGRSVGLFAATTDKAMCKNASRRDRSADT